MEKELPKISEKEFIEPKEFQKHQIQIGKETIEYVEQLAKEIKEGEKQEAIFLMPGFCTTVDAFKDIFYEMKKCFPYARILIAAPLGIEKSSTPKDSSIYHSLNITKEFLKRLNIQKEKTNLTLVTHSKSDIEALMLASQEPELVKNLVLVNPALNGRTLLELGFKILQKIPKEAMRYPFEALKLGARSLKGVTVKGLLYQLKSIKWREKIDWETLIKRLNADILVISGTEDITPIENTSKQFQGAKKVEHRILADQGHEWLFYEPEALALTIKSWMESKNKRRKK